jgi:hypothetical protein
MGNMMMMISCSQFANPPAVIHAHKAKRKTPSPTPEADDKILDNSSVTKRVQLFISILHRAASCLRENS